MILRSANEVVLGSRYRVNVYVFRVVYYGLSMICRSLEVEQARKLWAVYAARLPSTSKYRRDVVVC